MFLINTQREEFCSCEREKNKLMKGTTFYIEIRTSTTSERDFI